MLQIFLEPHEVVKTGSLPAKRPQSWAEEACLCSDDTSGVESAAAGQAGKGTEVEDPTGHLEGTGLFLWAGGSPKRVSRPSD